MKTLTYQAGVMELFRTIVGEASLTKGPIILFHGLFGSSRNWQTLAPPLSTHLARQIICVDMRNHGRSVKFQQNIPIAAPMTWETLADDTEYLIREHKGNPVVLMGHSLGGQVAMQTLFRRPGLAPLLRCLILVDIAPTPLNFASTIMNHYLKTMESIDELYLGNRQAAIREFKKILPDTDESIVQFLFTNWGKREDGKEGFMLPLRGLHSSLLKLSETNMYPDKPLSIPTLFIKGAKSDYIQSDDLIKKCFSDYLIEEIPNAGHWVHHEAPVAFQKVILHFLDDQK